MTERIDTFALSNLRSATTGIEGAILWIAAGEFGGADHDRGPRILVVVGDTLTLKDAVTVLVTEPVEVLGELPPAIRERVTKFIETNRTAMLAHWNGKIDTGETLGLLKRIG